MSLIRRRKPASALATRMAEALLAKHREALRGVTTLDAARGALGRELERARTEFDQKIVPERRGEKLFDRALVAALGYASAPLPAPSARPLVPKVIPSEARSKAMVDGSYRDAPPEEDLPLRPSRLMPEPSALARVRYRLVFAAAWIVAVIRFAVPIRAHGLGKLAMLQGLLGTVALLPFVLGVLLLILPRR